jgi:hypothetical protein
MSENDEGIVRRSAVVRPEPIRAKVGIPTPTIHVRDVQHMDETGHTVTAKATVSGTDELHEAVEVEATLTPVWRLREAVGEDTDVVGYQLVVVGGPGEMLEVVLEREDGEVVFHDMDHTDWTPHWASVALVERLAEALVRDMEGI